MSAAGPESTARLTIGNAIAEMAKVAEFVDRFGSDHHIPKAALNALNISLDELLNNTISYGYDDHEPHPIVISLSLIDGLLTAEIRDDAKPFDPRTERPAASGGTLQSRKLGGLGIQFVKTLMDHLGYTREGNSNVVMLSKRVRGDY